MRRTTKKTTDLCAEDKEVAFLLHFRAAISQSHFQSVLTFVHDLIDRFQRNDEDTRVAVVSSTPGRQGEIGFDSYMTWDELKTAVGKIGDNTTATNITITSSNSNSSSTNITTTTSSSNNSSSTNISSSNGNGTALSEAISRAAGMLSGDDLSEQIVIIVTDVTANENDTALKKVVDTAVERYQDILAVGVGGNEVKEGLKLMTTDNSTQFVYSVVRFHRLSSLLDHLSSNMCLVLNATSGNTTMTLNETVVDESVGEEQELNATSVNATTSRGVSNTTSFNTTTTPVSNTTSFNTTTTPELNATVVNSTTDGGEACPAKHVRLAFLLPNALSLSADNMTAVVHFMQNVSTLVLGSEAAKQPGMFTVVRGKVVSTPQYLGPPPAQKDDVQGLMNAIRMRNLTTTSGPVSKDSPLFPTSQKAGGGDNSSSSGGEEEKNGTRVVVVVGTGTLSPKDVNDTLKVLQRLLEDGVQLVAVGVDGASPGDLAVTASQPQKGFKLDGYDELTIVQESVVQEVCQETPAKVEKQLREKDIPEPKTLKLFAM